MQLKTHDGVACDWCGTIYRTDFKYYSFDFRHITVVNNMHPSMEDMLNLQPVFSIDICERCFETFKPKIAANYAKSMRNDRRKPALLVCDWTGNQLIGNYELYQCDVTAVSVQISGQPHICAECQTKTFEPSKPCAKCKSVNFVCPARMAMDAHFVELVLCSAAFDEFVDKTKTTRKIAGEWSTHV